MPVIKEKGHGSQRVGFIPERTRLGVGKPMGECPYIGKRALLVDDNELVRLVFAVKLVDMGFTVTPCSDTRPAQESLGSGRYDLLLTDLSFAGELNGLELIEAAAVICPGMVRILMSAMDAPGIFIEKGLPAHAAFCKIDGLDELERLIRTVMPVR